MLRFNHGAEKPLFKNSNPFVMKILKSLRRDKKLLNRLLQKHLGVQTPKINQSYFNNNGFRISGIIHNDKIIRGIWL